MGRGLQNLFGGPMGGWAGAEEDTALRIGLLNNMPDAALETTERQFFRLMAAAAPELRIRWYLFSLETLPRSTDGGLHLVRQYYGRPRDLYRTELDALIVTGTEPQQTDLRLEPYWPELAQIFDWIEYERRPAIFSCLAAHAAVLHFDGIARHRLSEKRFGVFEHGAVCDHVLTASLPNAVPVAHSRWNELPADRLGDAGYRVLTYAPEAGADLFVSRKRDHLLFLQGHPEYEPDTLAREYRRDVRRFLAGRAERYPEFPKNYFDVREREKLTRFRTQALVERHESVMERFPPIARQAARAKTPMTAVLGTWLHQMVETADAPGAHRARHQPSLVHTP